MITVDDVKADRRIEGSDEDSLIQSKLSAALQYIERRTGQTFVQRDQEAMVLDGLPVGGVGIELDWTPVRSVQSVEYRDADGADQSLASEALFLDNRGVYPTLFPAEDAAWPDSKWGRGSVRIVADIGYEELPYDIRCAALLLTGHLYENREAVVIGTIATSVPMGFELLIADYIIDRVG